MNLEVARELLAYNTWANGQMLEAVSRLDAAQFSRELGGVYHTIQATLTPILWDEWVWLARWQDQSPMQLFEPSEFPSVESMKERWQSVQAGQRAVVASLTDERLQRVGRDTQ